MSFIAINNKKDGKVHFVNCNHIISFHSGNLVGETFIMLINGQSLETSLDPISVQQAINDAQRNEYRYLPVNH